MRAICSTVFLAVLLLPLASNAQMNEQDRQNRCVNNQARVEALEKQHASYDSDEEIARMRAAVFAITQAFAKDNLSTGSAAAREPKYRAMWAPPDLNADQLGPTQRRRA